MTPGGPTLNDGGLQVQGTVTVLLPDSRNNRFRLAGQVVSGMVMVTVVGWPGSSVPLAGLN